MAQFSDINIDSNRIGNDDLVYDLASIRQSVFTILSTIKRERLFRPDFGSSIENLLFDPIDDITTFYIKNEIFEVLEKYEPRITVNRSKSSVIPNYENQYYKVHLEYSITSLGLTSTLTFNMSKSKGI